MMLVQSAKSRLYRFVDDLRRERRIQRWRSYFDGFAAGILNSYMTCNSTSENDLSETERRQVADLWLGACGQVPADTFFKLAKVATGAFDAHYVPDELWFEYLLPSLNPLAASMALQDKALYGFYFNDIKRPVEFFRSIEGNCYDRQNNLVSRSEAIDTVLSFAQPVLVKPIRGAGCGSGIRMLEQFDRAAIERLFREYQNNFSVQQIVDQCPDTKYWNPTSLNTFRVTTLFLNGRLSVQSIIFRVGGRGSCVDNVGAGGYAVGVNLDGTMGRYGYSKTEFREVDASNRRFNGYQFASIAKVVDLAKRLHLRMPFMSLIGWDIALDADGEAVLIELNSASPGILFEQLGSGPLFGDRFDEVMEYVKAHPAVFNEDYCGWRSDWRLI